MTRKAFTVWYKTYDKKLVYLGKSVAYTVSEAKEIIQRRLMKQKDMANYLNISCYVTNGPKAQPGMKIGTAIAYDK